MVVAGLVVAAIDRQAAAEGHLSALIKSVSLWMGWDGMDGMDAAC